MGVGWGGGGDGGLDRSGAGGLDGGCVMFEYY